LRQRFGHDVREEGEGERVLAGAVVEQFARRKDGQLELVVPGSTLAVAETRTHERTRRNCMGYRFGTGSLPVPSHRGHGLYGGRG